MSPRNSVHNAGAWPCGIATSSDHHKQSAGILLPIEIPLPTASRPQPRQPSWPPQAAELLRLVLPLCGQEKHTFLSIKPAMTKIGEGGRGAAWIGVVELPGYFGAACARFSAAFPLNLTFSLGEKEKGGAWFGR